VDGSEDLSYEELNTFMMLDSVELLHFIKTMNELGGIYTDEEDEADMHSQLVPRHVFVENFVDALEHASNFSCTKMEAEKLFDELVAAKAKADLEDGRRGSSKRSRRASLSRMSRRGSHATPKLKLSDLFNSECSNYLTEAEINALAKRIRNQKRRRVTSTTDLSNVVVTKQEFVRYYPKMLEDVTGRGGGLKDFKAKSNIGDGFDLSFTKLCLTVKVGGKSVNTVNNLTGRLQAKTMTAVMGGSGSGKTSLLNALSGRASYGELSGTIRVNGIQSAMATHKNEVGYVPQDDIVYHELTVKENLMYSGRFQLQAGIKKHEIEDLADEVLANLGLMKVKDVIVGDVGKRGISGGERKRVNIGIELMRKPQILFLGECHDVLYFLAWVPIGWFDFPLFSAF
jgi:ABC-type lipoprotein export system ATPase subunit